MLKMCNGWKQQPLGYELSYQQLSAHISKTHVINLILILSIKHVPFKK